MKASRITAVGLVAAATLWIASGYFLPHESAESVAAVRPTEPQAKLFRVGVQSIEVAPHRQKFTLSGRTEADRKVTITARTGGELKELRVRRGSVVKKGDVIAVLSDDAREAQVQQAKAVVNQRRTELEAKGRLIASGAMPRLELGNLEAQLKVSEAQLASAQAELQRGVVTAPWDGIIADVPAEVGGAAFSFAGTAIAQLVGLDPMLAVVEVAERRLSGVSVDDPAEVRLVTGQKAKGRVRFVSPTASANTRTYRVEVEIPNADGAIPDGITAEVTIRLAPVPAARVPRSALTFSSTGELGVRVVAAEDKVVFVPVSVLEDEQSAMWVTGLTGTSRVIVEGQDFVRDGQRVEAAAASDLKTATR